jgi:hypothetical protein
MAGGSTDPVENSGTGGNFTVGGDATVGDDLTVTDVTTTKTVVTTGADNTVHMSFGGTAATNMAFIPQAGATPSLRLKAATASNATSNVSDGALICEEAAISVSDTSGNGYVIMNRTNGLVITNLGTPALSATAGTMTGAGINRIRRGWIPCLWTNSMVTALGASLTGDISVCVIPAKCIVHRCMVVITGQGAGTTTLTVSVGRTAASYIDYVVASDAKAAANTVYGDVDAEIGTNLLTTGAADTTATARKDDFPSFTGTTTINAHFISTVENLSSVTGSTGTVYLEISVLP